MNRSLRTISVGVLFVFLFAALPPQAQAADTISTAEYLDNDGDGQVETIRWEMDENVTACAYEAGDWTVDTAGTINVTAVTGITCTGADAFLDISVTADADITGGATNPVISYAQAAGVADSVTLTSGAMTDKTQAASDGAAPIILALSSYVDDGNFSNVAQDGTIDQFSIFLTEDTTFDECEAADWTLTANDFTGLVIDCTGFSNFVDAVGFHVTGAPGQTGVGGVGTEPTIEYTGGGATALSIVDTAGNELSTAQGPVSMGDAANPTVADAEYLDTDGDGQIDAFNLTFTEEVVAASVLSANDLTFTDVGDFTGAAFGADATDLITVDSTSVQVDLGTEATAVDTSEDSATLDIDGQNAFSLVDATSNSWDDVGVPTYTDGPDPVIASVSPADAATGASRTGNITATFSEGMDATFAEGTEFTVTPDPGSFTVTWSGSDDVVTLNPDVTLLALQAYNVVFDETEIVSSNAEALVLTGPEDGDWTFTTGSGGSSGGGSSTPLESTTPNVDLTAPNSGTLVIGDEVDITWTTSGNLINTVKLEVSTNGGATYSVIADDIDPDLGTYAWTVSGDVSSSVILKITAQDTGKGYLDTDVSGTLAIESSSPASEEEEEPTQEEEDADAGITTDEEGRRWAPGSGEMGSSPFDGSQEEISEVQAGWYVRGENYDTVYYLPGDGTRRPFWDAQTFMTWADSWDEVVWVSNATLQTLTLTTPMLPEPGRVLIKITSDPRVYHVEVDATTSAFQLRHVTEEAIASTMFGMNWADYVIDVDPTIFTHYEAGTSITFAEDVDTSDMETRMEIANQVAGN